MPELIYFSVYLGERGKGTFEGYCWAESEAKAIEIVCGNDLGNTPYYAEAKE